MLNVKYEDYDLLVISRVSNVPQLLRLRILPFIQLIIPIDP